MLYLINDKVCIAVTSYYKEVEIRKNSKDYTVLVKKDTAKIERKKSDTYKTLSLEEAYKRMSKHNSSIVEE